MMINRTQLYGKKSRSHGVTVKNRGCSSTRSHLCLYNNTVDRDFFVVKIFLYIATRKFENYFYKILLLNEILVKYVSKY